MKKRNCAVLLMAAVSISALTGCSAEKAARLTMEEAQAIVLEHAGFAAEDVQWLRTELEMDDRVPQYEVQFRQGGLAYEYEIHGETGEILSMDVDG